MSRKTEIRDILPVGAPWTVTQAYSKAQRQIAQSPIAYLRRWVPTTKARPRDARQICR